MYFHKHINEMYVYDICRNHLYAKLKISISQTPASMPFDIILLKPVYIPFKMHPAASDYALLSNNNNINSSVYVILCINCTNYYSPSFKKSFCIRSFQKEMPLWSPFIDWRNYLFRGGLAIGALWSSFGGKIEPATIRFDGRFEKTTLLRRTKYPEIIKLCIKNLLIERNEQNKTWWT